MPSSTVTSPSSPTSVGSMRAEPGILPESAATLVMDWDVLKAGNGTLKLQLVANYQDDAVPFSTIQGA